jgi:hypothetical protein
MNTGKPFDFNMRKPTALEELERRLTMHFEMRMLNIIRQVRAVCIAAKIDPTKFIEAFHDDIQQDVFFKNQHSAEEKLEADKKKEETKKDEQISKFIVKE